jgi:cold-inducible RNA-binding protein
LATSIRLV